VRQIVAEYGVKAYAYLLGYLVLSLIF